MLAKPFSLNARNNLSNKMHKCMKQPSYLKVLKLKCFLTGNQKEVKNLLLRSSYSLGCEIHSRS